MMLALTIWQPWATLIALGHKDIENRDWAPPRHLIGHRFAIHAGKTVEPGIAEDFPELLEGKPLPRGAIIATAELRGVLTRSLRDTDPPGCYRKYDWFQGKFGWHLDRIISFEPVECRGAQGLWPVPPEIEALVLARELVVDPRTVATLREGSK